MEQSMMYDKDLVNKQEDSSVLFIKEEPKQDIFVKSELCDLPIDPLKVEPGLDCSSVEHKNIEGQSNSRVSKTTGKEGRQTKKRQVLGSQAKELIAMIYKHMKNEAINGVENVTDARWRTSQATGVSEKTVSRILKEKRKAEETGTPMTSPHRNKKPRKCIRRDMEENEEIIKETIKNYEKEFNKTPTLLGLKEVLSERIGFNGCIETLRRLLNKIGYEFNATEKNSYRFKVLVEKH